MSKQEKLAFRILASLYPDRRPSEIRKIIDDALEKEERKDDIELWSILTKEKSEDDKTDVVVKERIIEHHHYNDWWARPYITYADSKPTDTDRITITCDSITSSNDYAASSITNGTTAVSTSYCM